MQIHWPLVISTACQRAGLGLVLCAFCANLLLGAHLPMNAVALASLALLVIGGAASVFHLQRPQRFFNAFSNPKSHLTQEGVVTPFLGIALLLCGMGIGGFATECIAVLLSAAFLVCTGLAYQMKSRPAWNTWYVLALFIMTALSAGSAGAALLSLIVNSGSSFALCIGAFIAAAATLLVQVGYVSRMSKVGYGVAYKAFEQPYKPAAATWAAFGVASAALTAIAALSPLAPLAALAWACSVVSIAAWTVLFFKGAHKVKMFPMYSQDLNLDM